MFPFSDLNKAFFDISQSVKDNAITILYGGRNSSKTHSCYQFVLNEMWNKKIKVIWYRDTGAKLESKAYKPFLELLTKHKIGQPIMESAFHNFKKKITLANGSVCDFDFVNGGNSKGISGYKIVVIDEIDECSFNDVLTVLTSHRGEGVRFIFMFNPVSEKHWLKDTFFNETPTEFQKISKAFHYTIENNKFATKQDYIILDALEHVDRNKWRIERWGLWGQTTIQNPFISAFDYNTHVVEDGVKWFSDYEICLGFDFGLIESCTVGQHFYDYEIASDGELSEYFNPNMNAATVIDEYRAEGNFSNVGAIVQQIVQKYGTNTSYFVTGDTSGGSHPFSKFVEIQHHFEACGAYFVNIPQRFKPTYFMSRTVTNWSLSTYGSNYKIDSKCDVLISDILSVKADGLGNLDKIDAIKRNIGHILDSWRYLNFMKEAPNFLRASGAYGQELLGMAS